MALIRNFAVDQNSTFTASVTVYDDQGLLLNMNGFTGTSQIRKTHTSSTVSGTFTIDMTDGNVGVIKLSMTDEETLAVKAGRYVYDVVVEDISGQKYRVIEGIVEFTPAVTRI